MLEIHEDGPILNVRLKDCSLLSLHDLAAGTELRDAVRDADERDDIKVVVISAGEADFCRALSPGESAVAVHATGQIGWHQIYATSSGLYQSLCFSRKPNITVIQGVCAGAGSMLAMCSDLTFASDDATFLSPFGVLPEANFALAALTMRLNRAKSWIFSGTGLSATEAHEAGLVNHVFGGDRLLEEARLQALRISRIPLDGLAMSKLMVEACLDGQGVGQEFDATSFHALALREAWNSIGVREGKQP